MRPRLQLTFATLCAGQQASSKFTASLMLAIQSAPAVSNAMGCILPDKLLAITCLGPILLSGARPALSAVPSPESCGNGQDFCLSDACGCAHPRRPVLPVVHALSDNDGYHELAPEALTLPCRLLDRLQSPRQRLRGYSRHQGEDKGQD